jgi:thiol-disulfide isomerase/thioredoxin
MLTQLYTLLPSVPDALVIGPLLLPMTRLIFVLAIIATFIVSTFLERRYKINDAWGLWLVLLTGFGAARLVHVLQFHTIYQNAPMDVLYVWQGGFHVASGLVTALFVAWLWSQRQQQPWRVLFAPIVTGALIWGLGTSVIQASPAPSQALPNITVQQLNGQPINLATIAPGTPVVINLWASWCPPCRREMPTFERAQSAHPEIQFIYANQGESLETIAHYLNEHDLELDLVVADPRALLSSTFSALGLPMTLFFDAQGQLIQQHMGELSAVQLERALKPLQEIDL